jgi:hypothetical protein
VKRHWSLRSILCGVSAASIIASSSILTLPSPSLADIPPSCPESASYQVFRFFANFQQTGALASWQLRTIHAADWSLGGHTNTTMWFGTDGDVGNSWIEVGAMWGYLSHNKLEFYGTKRYPSGASYIYKTHLFSLTPVPLHNVTFKVIHANTGSMRASVTDNNTTNVETWETSTNSPPFDEWQLGTEYTCSAGGSGSGSHVQSTYVYDNEYRKASDSTWAYPIQGYANPPHSHGPGGDLAWCNGENIKFRFWVHDVDGGCS